MALPRYLEKRKKGNENKGSMSHAQPHSPETNQYVTIDVFHAVLRRKSAWDVTESGAVMVSISAISSIATNRPKCE